LAPDGLLGRRTGATEMQAFSVPAGGRQEQHAAVTAHHHEMPCVAEIPGAQAVQTLLQTCIFPFVEIVAGTNDPAVGFEEAGMGELVRHPGRIVR
jgi:hypothetical protein